MSDEIRTIKLKVKLRAYTRGVIPDVSKFIEDAPQDGILYGRRDGQWLNIDDVLENNIVLVDPGSGLDKVEIDKSRIKLSIRQWTGSNEEYEALPDLQNDKVYYVYDSREIQFYLDGGTAFTDSDVITEDMEIDNILGNIIDGGNSTTYKANLYLEGIDSKGE